MSKPVDLDAAFRITVETATTEPEDLHRLGRARRHATAITLDDLITTLYGAMLDVEKGTMKAERAQALAKLADATRACMADDRSVRNEKRIDALVEAEKLATKVAGRMMFGNDGPAPDLTEEEAEDLAAGVSSVIWSVLKEALTTGSQPRPIRADEFRVAVDEQRKKRRAV